MFREGHRGREFRATLWGGKEKGEKRTDEDKALNDHRPKLRVAVGGFVEAAREVRMEESGARREGLSFSLEAVRALLRPCGGGLPLEKEGVPDRGQSGGLLAWVVVGGEWPPRSRVISVR